MKVHIEKIAINTILFMLYYMTAQAGTIVGALQGDFSVDNTGAANYSISLEIPPGVNNLEPSLSLRYNSNHGNSVFGMGWILDFEYPKSILRGGTIFAREGLVKGITLDNSDKLYLDGKLLVKQGENQGSGSTNNSYWEVGSYYRTEVESFLEIQSGGYGADIQWFSAKRKDGLKFHFGAWDEDGSGTLSGAELSGYQTAPSASLETKAPSYAIRMVEDTYGNRIIFDYINIGSNDHAQYLMNCIRYGSESVEYSVRFSFEDRKDVQRSFFPDQEFRIDQRVKYVSVYRNSVLIKEYGLNYDNGVSTDRSRLTDISCRSLSTNGNFEIIPPTILKYTDSNIDDMKFEERMVDAASRQISGAKRFFVDMDGDGRPDLLEVYGHYYGNWSHPHNNKIYVSLFGENGFEERVLWYSTDTQSKHIGTPLVGDFNGDGMTDIVLNTRYPNDDYSLAKQISESELLISTGSGFNRIAAQNWYIPQKMDPFLEVLTTFKVADFNGDGRDDIVCAYHPKYVKNGSYDTFKIKVLISTGIGFEDPIVNGGGSWLLEDFGMDHWTPNEKYSIDAKDCNGDGMADIIIGKGPGWYGMSQGGIGQGLGGSYEAYLHDGNIYVSLSKGNGIAPLELWLDCEEIPVENFGGKLNRHALTGFEDFNGDGKADVFINNNGTYLVGLSTGTSFKEPIIWSNNGVLPTSYSPLGSYSFDTSTLLDFVPLQMWRDFNGDGLVDYILLDLFDDTNVTGQWFSPRPNYHARVRGFAPNSYIKGCYLWLSRGDHFSEPIRILDSEVNEYIPHRISAIYGLLNIENDLDFNADGITDLLSVDDIQAHAGITYSLKSIKLQYQFSDANIADLLQEIENGLGSTVKVKYGFTSDGSTHTRGTVTSYPIQEYFSRRRIVSDVYKDTGGALAHYSHQYSGGRRDLSGRGDLGFHSMVTYDHQTNLINYQFLSQSFPITGVVKREQIYKALNPIFQNGILQSVDLLPISSRDNDVIFDEVVGNNNTVTGSVFGFIPRSRDLRWEYSVANPLQLTADDSESLFAEYNNSYSANRALAHSEIETYYWYDNQNWTNLPETELPNGASTYFDPANAPPGAQDAKPVGFLDWLLALDDFSLPGNITQGNITRTQINYSDGYKTDSFFSFYPPSTSNAQRRDLIKWSQVVQTTPNYGVQGEPVSRFSYNSNGKIQTEQTDTSGSGPQAANVAYPNGNLSSSMSYVYFSNGCLKKSTFIDGSANPLYDIDGGNPITVTEVDQLDATGRFPEVIKNAYGHLTTTHFDDYGRKILTNDVNGQATSILYDGLGRVIQSDDLLRGLKVNNSIGFTNGQSGILAPQTVAIPSTLLGIGIAQTSTYFLRQTSSGKPPITTHFDRLGRPFRVIREGYAGNVTYTDSIYDNRSKVVATSTPYPQGGVPEWVITNYDELGRVKSVIQPNGTVSNTTYSGRVIQVTVDAPLQSGVDPAPQIATSLVNVRGETIKVWNPDNQPSSFSQTSVAGAPSLTFSYDGFGNVRNTAARDSSMVTAEFDTLGNQILLDDPNTGVWYYAFDARGRMRQQTDANLSVTKIRYDVLDRQLQRTTEEIDGASETTDWYYYDVSTNAGMPNIVVKPAHQWIGAVQRQELVARYVANPADQLRNYSNSDAFYYDEKGNNYITLQNLDGKWFYSHSNFDELNRLKSKTHFWRPPGLEYNHGDQLGKWKSYGFVNIYDEKSYIRSVKDTYGQVWWLAHSSGGYDHMDRPVLYQMGNGHWSQRLYDSAQGTLRYVRTGAFGANSVIGSIQNNEFRYDGLGNVIFRADFVRGNSESFAYDGLNRVIEAQVGGTALNYNYHSNGNIQGKDNVENNAGGSYGYHSTKIHAVTNAFGYSIDYDNNGNANSRSGNGEVWSFNWNGYDKPRWMGRDTATTTRGSAFLYGSDRMRIAQLEFKSFTRPLSSLHPSQWNPTNFTKKKLYTRDGSTELEYEKTLDTDGWQLSLVRVSIPSPAGSVGTAELNPNSASLGNHQFLVYHQDHLGSIQAITEFGVDNPSDLAIDSSGRKSLYSYDPWGSRRNPSDWIGGATSQNTFTHGADDQSTFGINEDDLIPRGFTGHEMLDDLSLIHMNGRIYDPQIGRFLSADILIQDPFNLQSYNRYSYVLNAPLNYTDPNGYQYHWYQGGWLRESAYDPVYNGTAAALANPRVQGGLQLAGGIAEATIGAAAIAAPEPTVTKVIGVGLIVHGADNAATGFNRLIYGDAVTSHTLTNQGIKHGLEALGASSETAQQLADNTEMAGEMFGGGGVMKSLAKQSGNLVKNGGDAVSAIAENSVKSRQLTEVSPQSPARTKIGVQANRQAGQIGENFLQDTYGGRSQVFRPTSTGGRYIDNLADGIAMESKVGRTSLTSRVQSQIAKDVELMNTPGSGVTRVQWHFFPSKTGVGPTAPLREALEKAGIGIITYSR